MAMDPQDPQLEDVLDAIKLDFGHSGIDPLQSRKEQAGTVRKFGNVRWEGRHHEITQSPISLQESFQLAAFFLLSGCRENGQSRVKDGVEKCGVIAERIDEVLSNEPITKRMLEAIDSAEFVVVDLSNARPNVYYEAGYAQGLGKTPVYVARKGTEIPFDLKDYPVILYSNLRDLKASLGERLRAIRSGRK